MNAAMRLAPLPPVVGHLTGVADVALFTCDLDAGGAAGLAADRALLAPDEHARADRFHFDRDRERYIRGRAFMRRRLAEVTGRAAQALPLVDGPWGKPALRDGAVAFNLSHSGALAVLAISRAGPVGIDVERIDRTIDVPGLSQSCFLPAERAVLDALEPDARQRRFFAFWTAKEAVMKRTGQGMSLPPLEIALQLEQGWPVAGLPVGAGDPGDTQHSGSGAPVALIYPDLEGCDAICCLAQAPEPAPSIPLIQKGKN
ncbi:4'-phosphopantetheinyl transferase family protein [Gymnodinialimonas ulvae]|uniref:4'-phosphopantetheinyl transferase family protein n=1 Tax=Gymnodinialimonas ulvae TaxID=3126504 RepID=UPI0030B1B830